MTETTVPNPNDNLIQRDAQGDIIPLGTRMIEADSYDRLRDGLRIAAEAAAHIAVHEYRSNNVKGANLYAGLARRLDQCRRIAVEYTKIGDAQRERETQEVRSEPMPYFKARKRLRDGLKQASGGMRQLATCHRLDLRFSGMAQSLDEMQRKLTQPRSPIIMPPRGLMN